MADLIASALVVTNLVSASGACRIQIFGGNPGNQWLICDLELTAAQNAALSTALAATAGTVSTTTVAAAPSPLPGVYNAI